MGTRRATRAAATIALSKIAGQRFLSTLIVTAVLCLSLLPVVASAQASLPPTVIDDFEDGDSSDWGFFGGNNAGGGGGVLDDRPYEGVYYFSTGWGGQGTASDFYGGAFRNLDNAAQVTPPADPWFNVWVLNQSNATADQYRLEITLREDTNGDGWTNGAEDSIRLDTTFTSAEFGDEWVLVSAPLSSFTNLGTGGDGVFNGDLDEVVIVIAGVTGADGSVVEVDFDQFSFTSGGPVSSSGTVLVFDDMEHGDPFNNGWFAFGGSVGGGGIDPNSADLPPMDGGVFSLQTGWGSGGTPGFFGGFGRTNPTDLTGTTTFSFWINPDAGQDYTLEINLQDDDNGDGAANPADDDEFQFNCVVSPAGPCAISGGGWQKVSIPLDDFFRDPSFLFGGNGVFDPVAVANGGNGELINVVIAVIGNTGSDASFRTDYWVFSSGEEPEPSLIVDDFENGLPFGVDGNGAPVGFFPFSDGSPIGIATTNAPPAPVPDSNDPNNVIAVTGNIAAFAGFIHAFENEAVDTWVTQDWSAFEGFRVWVYGQNTGTGLFIDILDNRNPGSTGDDAERFTVAFVDDFSGWRQLSFPFSTFVRKEIGNGAPNDGFTLTQVHGWAFGALATPGEVTWFLDNAELYGAAVVPPLAVTFTQRNTYFDEGTTGEIVVALNRPMNSDDPEYVSVDFATEDYTSTATEYRDYVPTSGTLTFVKGGATEQSFSIETIDDSKHERLERIALRLSNLVGLEPGFDMQASGFIVDNDPYDPNLLDDFEIGAFLWSADDVLGLNTPEINSGDALARPMQDTYERILSVATPIALDTVIAGSLCSNGNGVVPVAILTTPDFDATTVDHTSVRFGNAMETHSTKSGLKRHEEDFDGDGDIDLVFHFRVAGTGYGCDTRDTALTGSTFDGQPVGAGGNLAFGRDFAIGQDWSDGEALRFWYYGTGSGDEIKLTLKDNRAPDPGPAGWTLAWAEEFNDPAGTLPDSANWSYELGDVDPVGNLGWGNQELQFYTDDAANASMDGDGNLALTLRNADGSIECFYGPCEYTSARLVSKNKAEFAYGRIESRLRVPQGAGIWPAFWSLGTDIDRVGWPQTGEIDFMEFVGRLPNEIYGTIHGPGYSGGNSFAGIYDFGEPVFSGYHTFAVEWEPDLIRWYVDGILYHSATPEDVAPNPWVFNDPVYLLLNVAVGGNFGGEIGPDLMPPQSLLVDYVRIYQAPDTAERFEASFTDNIAGWQQVVIPFSSLTRSANQPAQAPDDGLTLTEVWGYGFSLPDGGTTSGSLLLDFVELQLTPPPTAITVTSTSDSGDNSLRQALADIAIGGTITFDPALAGSTINLTSGPLVPPSDVTIDASAAPGLSLSGGNADRVLVIDTGLDVRVSDLTVTNGYGFQLAGGILNNGSLTLERVIVTNNLMTTDGGEFWQGGGGIYNGDGATLNLIDSTVSHNSSGYAGGGVYSFFNTFVSVERSTISDNVALDVGGGFRGLGDLVISNSTISGNTSTAWHGGAGFFTDGMTHVINSTVIGNIAPVGTTGGLFVGTFAEAAASLDVLNSIVANNGDFGCFMGLFASGPVSLNSVGGSVYTDATCNPVASDQVVGDPGVGPLQNNGGSTDTHALQPGSPAIDSALNEFCPATDQRGVARDAACDSGSYESTVP